MRREKQIVLRTNFTATYGWLVEAELHSPLSDYPVWLALSMPVWPCGYALTMARRSNRPSVRYLRQSHHQGTRSLVVRRLR